MTTFYISRHGETENNRNHRLSGWIDSPLTTEGLEATHSVADKIKDLKIDKIYSSDLGRAFITAYIVAHEIGYEREITRLFGLRENSYGDVSYMLSVEAEAKYPRLHKDTNYVPPNGESLAQMQERVMKTAIGIAEAQNGKNVLLVTHDGVIKAINTSFSGQDLGAHNSTFGYPHDYVASFTLANGKVDSFTEIKH